MNPQKIKIVFFGDSITEFGDLPGGYINRIKDFARRDGVGDRFDFVGAGVRRDKVYDLYFRIKDDVLKKEPDFVIVFIGVNDVLHRKTGTGTDLDKFEKFYSAIIKEINAIGARPILVTPAVIGEKTDYSNGQDHDLNEFSLLIRDLAKKGGLFLIDLRKTFVEYNRRFNPSNKESGILTTDRVHLNDDGNQVVAEEMWKVIRKL